MKHKGNSMSGSCRQSRSYSVSCYFFTHVKSVTVGLCNPTPRNFFFLFNFTLAGGTVGQEERCTKWAFLIFTPSGNMLQVVKP